MSLCVWFILVVIRSECIFLESYIITISFTQHMYNVTFLVSRICFILSELFIYQLVHTLAHQLVNKKLIISRCTVRL